MNMDLTQALIVALATHAATFYDIGFWLLISAALGAIIAAVFIAIWLVSNYLEYD